MTGKQALMADSGSLLSPINKYTKPIPSFFNSPRLFTALSSKGFFETEALKSPTSILDAIWSDKNNTTTANRHPWENKLDSRGIGLALADVLNDETQDPKFSKPDSPMVLFGSQLKVQIPPLSQFLRSPTESPKSPTDFGLQTLRNSQSSLSSGFRKSPFGSVNSGLGGSPRVFTGCLSASEMESSEDYTCVITYGPNPKTTHIFDDCIVENCCGVIDLPTPKKERSNYRTQENFLSFCYTCRKNLGQGKDIYIYRGEKAFCSSECRSQEILQEEGMEKSDDLLMTYF